jgi:hypothetical protein
MTQKQFKQTYKPWFSKEILIKIGEKSKIFKKYIKCKEEIHKAELFAQFKTLKNEITHLTRVSKREYYRRYFTENKNNLQNMWIGIKDIINIKSKNFDYPTCLEVGDKTIDNPTEITNSFNNYFDNGSRSNLDEA